MPRFVRQGTPSRSSRSSREYRHTRELGPSTASLVVMVTGALPIARSRLPAGGTKPTGGAGGDAPVGEALIDRALRVPQAPSSVSGDPECQPHVDWFAA